MTQFIKLFIGLLLLPLCAAVTLCACQLLTEAATADFGSTMTLEEWSLPIGFILWAVIYQVFPKPWRTYVLGHELTHALWGLIMGARIGKMKVKSDGGSVELSKSNFIIALSPYFFPLYTVIIILAYLVVNIFVDLAAWRWLALLLIGFTWSFHVTFTIAMLLQHQSDVHDHGRMFSYTIIYLFNLLGICCWITAVGAPDWNDFIDILLEQSTTWYQIIWSFMRNLPEQIQTWITAGRQIISPQ